MRARTLLRLYPPAWRARYQEEVEALLDQHTVTLATFLDLLWSALDARLDPAFTTERSESSMARISPWLWALTGALAGVGLIAILSLGWALILLGAILAGATVWISRGHGLWALLVGFGLAPAAILLFDIATAPPPCPTQPVIVTGGSYTCGYTPPSYTYLAAGFLAVAVIGALVPLRRRIMRSPRPGHNGRSTGAA